MDSANGLVVKVKVHRVKDAPSSVPLKVRLFSEWTSCSCTSSAFGAEELPWANKDEFDQECTFQAVVDCDVSSEEKLSLLNTKPGIYVVYLSSDEPVGFTYVDCSSFLVEAGQSAAKHSKIFGYSIDVTVDCHAPLLPMAKCVKLEPVVLDIKR